jgi:hypothetical protein
MEQPTPTHSTLNIILSLGWAFGMFSKAQREHTPAALAEWLVDLARRTRVTLEIAA